MSLFINASNRYSTQVGGEFKKFFPDEEQETLLQYKDLFTRNREMLRELAAEERYQASLNDRKSIINLDSDDEDLEAGEVVLGMQEFEIEEQQSGLKATLSKLSTSAKRWLQPRLERTVENLQPLTELLKITWPLPATIAGSVAFVAARHLLCFSAGALVAPGLALGATGVYVIHRGYNYSGSENLRILASLTGAAALVAGVLAMPAITATHGGSC